MRLEGKLIRLRAVEPDDVEPMYRWENDPAVWHVSGTLAPFSRHQLQRFVDEQQFDIYQTRQMRLIIEALETGRPVGALDLFEFEPQHRRAGVASTTSMPAIARRSFNVCSSCALISSLLERSVSSPASTPVLS